LQQPSRGQIGGALGQQAQFALGVGDAPQLEQALHVGEVEVVALGCPGGVGALEVGAQQRFGQYALVWQQIQCQGGAVHRIGLQLQRLLRGLQRRPVVALQQIHAPQGGVRGGCGGGVGQRRLQRFMHHTPGGSAVAQAAQRGRDGADDVVAPLDRGHLNQALQHRANFARAVEGQQDLQLKAQRLIAVWKSARPIAGGVEGGIAGPALQRHVNRAPEQLGALQAHGGVEHEGVRAARVAALEFEFGQQQLVEGFGIERGGRAGKLQLERGCARLAGRLRGRRAVPKTEQQQGRQSGDPAKPPSDGLAHKGGSRSRGRGEGQAHDPMIIHALQLRSASRVPPARSVGGLNLLPKPAPCPNCPKSKPRA